MVEQMLTQEQVAERLAVTLCTVQMLVWRRRIESVKVGRKVRIPESAVEAYLAPRTRTVIPERRCTRSQ